MAKSIPPFRYIDGGAMTGSDFPVPDWPGKVAGDAGHDRIAAVLVMDIQRAPDWANTVLSHLRNVQEGVEDHWEMAMNAYILKAERKTSAIEPAYAEADEAVVTVRTRDLILALEAWCALLSDKPD
jgi:hypothetical protein